MANAETIHTVAVRYAQLLGRPVYALETDNTGRNRFTVHPGGRAYAIAR